MRKLMLALLMILSLQAVDAQVKKYRATSYSYKTYSYTYDVWTSWSDWYSCNINVYLNLNTDVITIYSNKTQVYKVYTSSDAYRDDNGGTQVKFTVIDQDGDKGTVRLRVTDDGKSQLYVDFADIMWVYNITFLSNSY